MEVRLEPESDISSKTLVKNRDLQMNSRINISEGGKFQHTYWNKG